MLTTLQFWTVTFPYPEYILKQRKMLFHMGVKLRLLSSWLFKNTLYEWRYRICEDDSDLWAEEFKGIFPSIHFPASSHIKITLVTNQIDSDANEAQE
jgi:hypothetical protein